MKRFLPIQFLITALAFTILASLRAAEPVIDVYVSTGDNHFLGSSLSIDSPASIEATFDLFKNVNHARRVYWRGLEASCWLRTMHARPENPRMFSFWEWLTELYGTVSPDVLAVKAAHARGMEIWGMGSLWDWGSPADTPGFGDYPFTFESKLKLAHPEWAPADKHGVRRQGGPIELAYPAARAALVDIIVQETLKAGYDGISFLTYVENYSLRFADEFGYSDPIVEDFKRQYKVDIRTEPFKRGASREDWLRLRGSYITAFLRELKSELDQHQIKLGMVANSNDPRQPQSWNVPELVMTAGSHFMDVDAWVREGLVDELLVYGNNSSQSQMKALDDLLFLARGTKTEVSVLTSGPFRESWKPYQEKGMPTVLAVNEDAHHIERGFVPEQKAEAITSVDVHVRMRILQQCIGGTLKLDDATIIACAQSPNMIERRLALQALGKHPEAPLEPLLAGLRDAENGVRCMAALALADRKTPAACAALLQAAEAHGNHMLRECVIIALRRLTPLPVAELSAAVLHSPSDEVREVAMRALMPNATAAMLPTFRAGSKDSTRFVRFTAAEALGNIAKSSEAIELLIATLDDNDPAIANRAAVSLGKLAALKRPETESLRAKTLAALSKGPSAPLKKPVELQPNEWTYVKEEDAFYLRLATNQSLDKANIRYPARSSAVVESISGSWLTVRNVTGTHVYNDGYNIHGAQRHTVFENIAAIECGDDGFSAHEDVDCHIDGFTSIGNATGLCDTGTSQTHYRNVFIKDCHGFDLYFIGLAHSMENALIESSAAHAFVLDGAALKDGSACNLTLKNVLIRRVGGGPQELRINAVGRLHAERCTFLGLNVTMTAGAAMDLQQCHIGGEPKPDVLLYANTIWRGNDNRYNVKSLRVGQTSFTAATFADFQKLTGSEKTSRWSAEPAGSDSGADEGSLQPLRQRDGRQNHGG